MKRSYASEMKSVNNVAGRFGKGGFGTMLGMERRRRPAQREEAPLGVARGQSPS